MESRKTCTHSGAVLRRGFTLIEILVVMAMLAIVGMLGLFASMDMLRGSSFRNERSSVISTLYKARSQAINNVCNGTGCTGGKPHGVHFVSGTYTLFQGASFASRDAALDETTSMSYQVAATPGSITDVVFAQLSGDATTTPADAYNLVLVDAAGHVSTTTFNSEGRIVWTN